MTILHPYTYADLAKMLPEQFLHIITSTSRVRNAVCVHLQITKRVSLFQQNASLLKITTRVIVCLFYKLIALNCANTRNS